MIFAYEAQTHTGQAVRGTIDSATREAADQQLLGMGLRVMQVQAVDGSKPKKSLAAADFLAFNQQLAQLTAAGLPVERGLRLIANDLRRGRLKNSVESIATRLEQGQSLDAVLAEHRGQFPPLYGQIVEAGIRSGNLSAVLLNLGRHLDTTRRLRTELVRATAYPLMVLLAIGVLVYFLSQSVFPQIIEVYYSFKFESYAPISWQTMRRGQLITFEVPAITYYTYVTSTILGPALVILSLLLLAIPLLWQAVPASRVTQMIDHLLRRAPLVGPVLRNSLIARWLDALQIAVSAGLDLPNALALASNAVASDAIGADAQKLIAALQSGWQLDQAGELTVLPSSIPSVLQAASIAGNLPETLALMAQSYQQQADQRISVIPAVLTPLLMTLVAILIGTLMLSLLAPMAKMMRMVTG